MENNKDKLFVGGDISGIQNFIYNITSRKAAVSLKGRSAWLNNYMKEVCDKILAVPEIKSSALTEKIYCGGGKFYLVVPDTPSIKSEIEKIKRSTVEYLWNEHYGQLGFNLAIVEYQDEFSKNFDEASKQFAEQKNRKFETLLLEQYDKFFEVQKVGGKPQVCAITGIEGATETIDDDDNKTIVVLKSVAKQIEEGLKKRKEQHITKNFNEFAKNSYLGILRMDVDNLGAAFRPPYCKTKEQYRQFSNGLTDFFEKRLNQIWEDKYRDWTDIIYAGGDDLFIVGRWDIVIDFAAEIQNTFTTDPKLKGCTLSGGMAIVGAKFPISKAAEMAGEAEDASKHIGNGAKNAFTFLGVTVSWKDEFDYTKKYMKQFVDLCENDNMPRSIMHKLMTLNAMRKEGELRYVWNTAYFLKRFADGKTKAVQDFCKALQTELLDARKFELIALAARWAELKLRKIINNIYTL